MRKIKIWFYLLIMIPTFTFSQKKMIVEFQKKPNSDLCYNSLCKISFHDDNIIIMTSESDSLSLPIAYIQKIYFKDGVNSINLDSIKTYNNKIVLFSNPTTQYIKFNFTGIVTIQINIYNSNGQSVKNIQSINNDEPISVGDLISGVYYIVTSLDNKTFKFIKL